jgi:hypothetical protein
VQLGPGVTIAYLYHEYDYVQPPPRLIVMNDMADLGPTYNNHVRSVRLGQVQPTATATATETPLPVLTNTPTSLPTAMATATATATPCLGTFQDVECSNPFYGYVQGLAAQNVISGYPCGAVNEPCVPPDNRPYYRGGNNLTRNQMAKIVALAGNYPDPQVSQIFQDVASDDPFYVYVQALGHANVVGGYTCGAANEPCVPPDNRPYYRGGNNLTRNQGAKIVYLALTQIRAHAPVRK